MTLNDTLTLIARVTVASTTLTQLRLTTREMQGCNTKAFINFVVLFLKTHPTHALAPTTTTHIGQTIERDYLRAFLLIIYNAAYQRYSVWGRFVWRA